MVYDIGIIGAGVAGLTAALEAKSLGYNVVLFEKRNLGGLSFNGGEIIVREFFEVIEEYKTMNLNFTLDADRTLDTILSKQHERINSYLNLFKGVNEVNLVYGKAEVVNKNLVVVDGNEYKFKKLILAHGSTSRLPKVEGIEDALKNGFAVKGHEILKIDKGLKTLAIVGSGRIAFELAIIFSAIGVKTYVLARGGFLNHLDDDFREIYLSKILNDNIILVDNVKLEKFENKTIYFKEDGIDTVLEVDHAIIAMGYYINNSLYDNLGLVTDEDGIITNDFLETNISGVYAIGDANNKPKFSNLAIAEAITSVNHILGHKVKIGYDDFVISVFGFTSYAYFGLSEKEIIAKGIPYHLKVIRPKEEVSERISLDYVKIMINKLTNEVLGIFIIGSRVINEMSSILNVINRSNQLEYENNFPTFTDSHYIGQVINNYFKEFMLNTIENKLVSFVQPKYRLKDNKITGAEVLSRFMINGNFTNPLPLIKSFEKNNMIIHLDLKVLENAVKFVSYLEKEKLIDEDFKISVNISPHTLKTVDVKNIGRIIKKHNIDRTRIIFEITERETEDINLTEEINLFKEKGYTISIDDFAIGSSSLPLLKEVEVDEVKIDMDLLPTEFDRELDLSIYTSIVRILKELKLTIVSEGVETLEQLEFLKNIEVDYAQGYYLSRPMSMEDFLKLLK